MEPNKNSAIVIAIRDGGLTQIQAAQRFGVSTRWIRTLLRRYDKDGLEGLTPRSRAPLTNPNATTHETIHTILQIRDQLTKAGLDAGAETIRSHLPTTNRPSVTTIWRILKRHQKIIPQPQKRPRSSWKRFESEMPNGMWQSDFTHWQIQKEKETEIISWLDDHSRKLLHCHAHPRITGSIVIDSFLTAADLHGLPAATLTDNGMVYTTRLARGGNNRQPNGFEQLLADLHITQKNGSPGHPTTQGKIERFHHTLKQWLRAQPLANNIDELNKQLQKFANIYNTQRPHRALKRRTPDETYNATPKAYPTLKENNTIWRIRYDTIDKGGKISLRYGGKLHHLGIGRAHAKKRAIILIHGTNTIVINRTTGTIIAEHTIDTNRTYHPKHKPEPLPDTPRKKPER